MNENKNIETVKPGIVETVATIFKRGWDANENPTKARTDNYVEQIKKADEKIEDKTLSRRERRYYKKQKERATYGLDIVDYENKNFINKAFFSVAVAAVAVYKTVEIARKL